MKNNEPTRLFLVILALSLLGACSNKPHQPPELPVKLFSVQATTIEDSSEFVATLQSRCSVTLQPLIEGQVAKIFVKLGDGVAAGTTIIQLDSAKQQVQSKYLKISSPCAGTVGDIFVNEGENVNTSTKLATIIQNQPLEVNISVPVAQASKMRLGMPVELVDWEQSVGTSQVFFISPRANETSQSVLVKSLFDNSKGQLRTGQSVRIKVIWDKRRGILIPTSAVAHLEGQTFVYVAQKEESKLIARRKPVKLGNIQGNYYQVIEGLQPGENLIVSKILNVSDGTAITPDP